MMLGEIARIRVEERLREGAEARRGRGVTRRRRRVRRAMGLGLVRAGNALLSGPKMKIA